MSEVMTTGGNGQEVTVGLTYLTQIALDPNMTAEKLQVMADVAIKLREADRRCQREDKAEAAEVAYKAAVARAQGRYPIVAKKGWQDYGKYAYIQFEDIWEQCCPIWTDEGLSVSFPARTLASGVIDMELHISHKDGHTHVVSSPEAPPDDSGTGGKANKVAVQANQSTMTYMKKGLLLQGMGIATKDKDDDGAGGAPLRPGPRPPAPPPPVRPREAISPPAQAAAPVQEAPQAPPSRWLGDAAAALFPLFKGNTSWERVASELTKLFGAVPTDQDRKGLAELVRPGLTTAPEWVRNQANALNTGARTRLQLAHPEPRKWVGPDPEPKATPPAPEFEAVLIDHDGMLHDTYYDPATYAQALVDLAGQTPATELGTMLQNNRKAIDMAEAYPAAVQILAILDDPDWPPPVESTPEPETPLAFEPIWGDRVPANSHDWATWRRDFKTEVTSVADANAPIDVLSWLSAQKTVLEVAPRLSQTEAIRAASDTLRKVKLQPPAWLGDMLRTK